jgi:hypothetical protein
MTLSLTAIWRTCCAAAMVWPALARPGAAQTGPLVVAQHESEHARPAAKGAAAKPAHPTGKPEATEAPEPQMPANPVGEFQPVLHAEAAKITTCMDTIVTESAAVIDSAHTAISSWNTAAPNDHEFVSIVGMSYPNKAAPNAAAVIVAAPGGNAKCQGATVQIYPVARSCSAIQAELIKEGHTIAVLRALPVVETKAGARDLLIPTSGGGCAVVAVVAR